VSGAPRQYAEWAAALDRFAAGDDDAVAAMEHGTLDWTAVVAERFTQRLHDAFFARLTDAQRRLGRDVDGARGDEVRLAQALVGIRHVLAPLVRVARLAALPESVRTHLHGELTRMADSMQQSLESSARADRRSGERLLAVVRRNPIRVPAPAGPVPPPSVPAPAQRPEPRPAPPGARRPIILP
jgi:hypothetical protein